ncbi:cytochrome P450 [Mycena floridula]|nr:cytochrome P450 [Mycena floridula]
MTSLLIGFVVVFYLFYRRFVKSVRQSRLPPGPRGLPIIGNVFDLPTKDPARALRDMSEKCNSGLIHLSICGTSVFVVNTRAVAERIFGQENGANYVDKPQFAMLTDLAGLDWATPVIPYGPRWKAHRTLLHKEFHYSSVDHDKNIARATKCLVSRLLDQPDCFEAHIRHMNDLFMLSTIYGIDVQDNNDPYTAILEAGVKAASAAASPSPTLFFIEAFPWLKYLPSWLPGAGFKRQGNDWKKAGLSTRQVPFKAVKRSMINGTASPSIAARNLQQMEDDCVRSPVNEQLVQDVLATAYSGSEVVVTVLLSFVLAMVQNPSVMKKAQAAVDEAVGSDRIPDLDDYHSIPYIDALVMEVIRWKPITQLMPYSAIHDDKHCGYEIPAGSMVLGNIWAMLNDSSVYGTDGDDFRPERFIKDGLLDPTVHYPTFAFGMGFRRACPGQDLGQAMVWCTIASIVACFDICKAVDENGVEITPSGGYLSGLMQLPEPFRSVFRPRSPKVEALIRAII